MPSIPQSFTSSLQLASDVSKLLEHTNMCRRKAAHLNNVVSKFSRFLKPLQHADINFMLVEATLRDILDPLSESFDTSADNSSVVLQLIYTKRASQLLSDAEQRLQTMIKVCRIRFQLPTPSEPIEQMEISDVEEDLQNLKTKIKYYQEYGYDQARPILQILEDRPDLSLADILEGRAGTRRQRRDLDAFLCLIRDLQESEMATIAQGKVTIDFPEQILGEGSFGQVVSGVLHHEGSDDRPVAIKRVREMRGRLQLTGQRALLAEAQSCRELHHKNIVCLLGTCIIQNELHLVMDRCDLSLEDLLYKFKGVETCPVLSLDDKEVILRGITRGLCYLHSKNVIHRDLKPAKVLLSRDLALVKLAGFGLGAKTSPNTTLVETISVAGTPMYMAPEVLQAPARWTTKADIYSLGVIVWEIYHEETPYEHLLYHPGELESMVLAGERPVISDEIPVKPWVVRIMKSCWDGKPGERPTAEEVLKRLESRGVERRSSSRVREIFDRLSRRNKRTSAKQGVEEVGYLVGKLGIRGNQNVLLRTLKRLREMFENEYKAAQIEEGHDELRRQARELGILVHLQRILKEEHGDPEVLSEALWTFHFVFFGEAAHEYTQAAIRTYGLGRTLVDIMQEHASDSTVQGPACACVRTLALTDDRNRVALVQDLNVGSKVVVAMRAHRMNADVQEQGCAAVCNLAVNDRNCETLGQDLNVGAEIVAAMREHRANAVVQEHACEALLNLTENPLNCEILVQDLNVGAEVVAAMRAHRTNADLQIKACDMLTRIALNVRNCESLMQDLNVGAEIVAAMRAHRTSVGVQNAACLGLIVLSSNNDRSREILGQDLNVGADIVAAMRAHRTNAYLQEVACSALSSLTENDRNQKILGQDLNVGAEIVAAMREHRTKAGVQVKACDLLTKLALNNRNQDTLGQDLNVGSEIVAAMRVHRASADVQSSAFMAVQNLAANSDRNREILGQNLNIGAEIVAAMRAHRTNADVQENACGALMNLALNDRNREILGQDLNVGAEIVAAMRAHRTSADVQKYACGALQNLAVNDRNKEILGQDLNVGAEIVATMRAHQTNSDLQIKACDMLARLALNGRNCESLIQHLNAGAEIVAAMRSHRTRLGVQHAACVGIVIFTLNNNRNREILGQDLNVGAEIVVAMRAHRTNADFQELACSALSLLAENDRNQKFLGQDLNVGAEIIDAMRKHRTNAGVQIKACDLLRNLAENDFNREILGQDLNVGAEILAAMRAHRTNADLQIKACMALQNLAANDRNCEILGPGLNIGAEIVAAMRTHPTIENVQYNACAALLNLASNGRYSEIPGQDSNVAAAILAAMRAYRTNEGLQVNACLILAKLAGGSDHNRVVLAQDLNAGADIINAMRAHRESERLQESACTAIFFLMLDHRSSRILISLGAREAVSEAYQRFPSSDICQEAHAELEQMNSSYYGSR